MTMVNIFLTKSENNVVKPVEPSFYKRFVDDVISRRKIDESDNLLNISINYHPNINFTFERNPSKFLDAKAIIENGKAVAIVYRKRNKLPSH